MYSRFPVQFAFIAERPKVLPTNPAKFRPLRQLTSGVRGGEMFQFVARWCGGCGVPDRDQLQRQSPGSHRSYLSHHRPVNTHAKLMKRPNKMLEAVLVRPCSPGPGGGGAAVRSSGDQHPLCGAGGGDTADLAQPATQTHCHCLQGWIVIYDIKPHRGFHIFGSELNT